jgi:hypothetical protein
MGLAMQGVLIGVIATVGMDIWAAVVKWPHAPAGIRPSRHRRIRCYSE